jgi:16S rRNA (guanine(966)-N(2))-methyltransferase RsmD
VKLAWFSVMGPRVDRARVLDLYSGAGSLGLEALSRGARSCLFVERSRECVAHLRANLARSGLEAAAEVRAGSVEDALRALDAEGRLFDLVFADPPFAAVKERAFSGEGGVLERAARLVAGPEGGGQAGVLMLRRERSRLDPPAVAGLAPLDRRAWGRSEVLFYAREVAERPG